MAATPAAAAGVAGVRAGRITSSGIVVMAACDPLPTLTPATARSAVAANGPQSVEETHKVFVVSSCRRLVLARSATRRRRRGQAAVGRRDSLHAVVVAGGGRGGIRRELLAARGGIPVDEHPVRIVAPRPDVQLVERGQAIAVRTADVLEVLSHEHRWSRGVRMPGVGEDQELDPEQPQPPAALFVDQQLGPIGVEHTVLDQGAVGEVDAHRSLLRAADTTAQRLIPGRLRDRHAAEVLGCQTDFPNQTGALTVAIVAAGERPRGIYRARNSGHTGRQQLFPVHRTLLGNGDARMLAGAARPAKVTGGDFTVKIRRNGGLYCCAFRTCRDVHQSPVCRSRPRPEAARSPPSSRPPRSRGSCRATGSRGRRCFAACSSVWSIGRWPAAPGN